MQFNYIRSLKDFRSQAIAAGLSRTVIWEHVCKALKVQSIFDLLDYPDSTLKSFRQISDKRVKELREVLGPLR